MTPTAFCEAFRSETRICSADGTMRCEAANTSWWLCWLKEEEVRGAG